MEGKALLRYGQKQEELALPLSIHKPEIDAVELEQCPTVYEDGSYSIEFSSDMLISEHVQRIDAFINDKYLGYLDFAVNDEAVCGRIHYEIRSNPRYPTNGKTYVNQPFLLHCDLVWLQFEVHMHDGTIYELYTDFLLCVSKNSKDVENIRLMMDKLVAFDKTNLGEGLFDRGISPLQSLQHTWTHQISKTLDNYSTLLDEIGQCYKTNYPYFKTMGKHTIKKEPILQSPFKVKAVTLNSFQWLMQNSDQLTEISAAKGVRYRNKYYVPLQISAENNVKSNDVYENQVVLSFINLVLNDAKQICIKYTEMLEQSQKEAQKQDSGESKTNAEQATAEVNNSSNVSSIDNISKATDNNKVSEISDSSSNQDKSEDSNASSYELGDYQTPILEVKTFQVTYCMGMINRLKESIDHLSTLQMQYMRLFNLNATPLLGMPRKTKTFQEIKPYTQVFAMILKWFNHGEVEFTQERLTLQIKTLDKLFEYYCLIELLNLLTSKGYKLDEGEGAVYTYPYSVNNTVHYRHDDIANTYILRKDGVEVTVYYQPLISSTEFQNNLSLYRTTNPHNMTDYYKPDFVLKFCKEGEESYVILDSKFSSRKNIMDWYLNDVLRKYSLEIAVNQEFPMPRMVWILQGRMLTGKEEEVWHYNNSPLAMQLKRNTSFGIIAMNAQQEGIKDSLWAEMQGVIPWI